jgi:hypothetical protein
MLIQQKRLMTLGVLCTVSVECGILFMLNILLNVDNQHTLLYVHNSQQENCLFGRAGRTRYIHEYIHWGLLISNLAYLFWVLNTDVCAFVIFF